MTTSFMSHPGMISGLHIIEDIFMTDTVEDWSNVRSPSRAQRRRKKHRQNIRFIQVPKPTFYKLGGSIVCHPETAKKLRAAIAKAQDRETAE